MAAAGAALAASVPVDVKLVAILAIRGAGAGSAQAEYMQPRLSGSRAEQLLAVAAAAPSSSARHVSRGSPAKLNSACPTRAAAGSAGSSKKKSFEVLAEEAPNGMGLVAVANLKPLICIERWWV